MHGTTVKNSVFMFKGLENREEYVRKINVVFSFWTNFDVYIWEVL